MTTKMRPITDTISIEEARRLIDERVQPVTRTEIVPLHEAGGRVIASDVISNADVPPFSRAGMDGYAVRAEDTFGASRYEPRGLACVEQVFTGQVPARV